ncbi:hypothetical protein L6164_003912 [Bauhinia variegata]|uniref:Uncharacterized protein n=1 Tax=Bauhinia variegata TaxID=167791 RepID=A0ACB9Q2T9_BAUVA|nr:hypothetical protein L6164_003912 [Bauhinia variegata]
MTLRNLITRVDAICTKYDKYDVDKQKEKEQNLKNVSGTDAFARLYGVVEADVDATQQKSVAAANEKNRAVAVALNAEIRRAKGRLLEEIPKLQRLALKRGKGVSNEEMNDRNDLVSDLKERIERIPDGTAAGLQQTGGWAASASHSAIKIDHISEGKFHNDYFQRTEQGDGFRQEYEMRKIKQDQDLDVIAEGLHTLKNMAHDVNEELDRQAPLIDEIDDKVEKANSDLKNTNVRLRDTVTKLRSSRNFCIDIILLVIILGIASYLYNVLK